MTNDAISQTPMYLTTGMLLYSNVYVFKVLKYQDTSILLYAGTKSSNHEMYYHGTKTLRDWVLSIEISKH